MTNQSEKNGILVKLKELQNKIALVKTNITGMKYVNNKLYNYNELLDEARNTKPSLMKLCAMIVLKY